MNVRVFCAGLDDRGYGGYNAHPRSDRPFIRVVPFLTALHNPPLCEVHNRPYRMIGGYRFERMLVAWQEHGIRLECDIRHGLEGAVWCDSHDWSRGQWDSRYIDDDGHCPMWRIGRWLHRRHHATDAVAA